ncbi:MAG: M24 family metallopeptidase, partial [Clostridiales bacterium]
SPAHNLIEYIRSFKDEDELACLAQAAAIADKAFALLLPEIKPNISEKQLAAKLIYYIYSCGGEELSFPSIIASGTNGAFCHVMPSDKLIADGDLITFDFGAVYRGYHSDMTRTLAVGKVNQKQKEIYSLVLEAQMAALDGLKAGLTGSQGDKLARDIIAAQGYGDNFGHSLGHGVGLEIHEYPNLAPSNNQKLAVNQVVTVEPGIYIPSWGGIRIEDTVIIKENGVEIINEFPKDLLIL